MTVSFRSKTIAVGALVVLAAGLIWTLAHRTQHDHKTNSAPDSGAILKAPEAEGDEVAVSEPEPQISVATLPVKNEAIANLEDEVQVDVSPAGVDGWPEAALEFAEEADPDPALSRYLEAEIHRLLDTMLDRGRYEAHSVTCRGYGCQVLTRDRTPDSISVRGQRSYSFMAPILRGLSSAGIRSPTTGVDLQPNIELVRGTRGAPAGVEFVIVFAIP